MSSIKHMYLCEIYAQTDTKKNDKKRKDNSTKEGCVQCIAEKVS